MKTALFAICCMLAVESIRGHTWSTWYNRDGPSGTGDWETLGSQKMLGYVCDGCKPIAAECRVKGSTGVFTRWSGTAPDTLYVHCLPTEGVVCRNADQTSGSCSNYEIRYLCPSTSSTWTSFYDRDDPSWTGDWENVQEFQDKDGISICNGNRPLCTQCRDRSNQQAYYSTGDKYNPGYVCNWERGLVCTTEVNTKVCKDYEVRFKCPIAAPECSCSLWTRWMSRDQPTSTGDWEIVAAVKGLNPCSGNEPIDIECRTIRTGQDWRDAGQEIRTKCIPSEGFVCVNSDQTSGQSCLDYEVRFLCP